MHTSLTDLIKGDRIKTIKSFVDFDGQVIPLGSEWTFKAYSYFVYDGGYTFTFEEGDIRMAEISTGEDSRVVDHAAEYFELLKPAPKDTWTSSR